ncbi:hypothetical protein I4U23_015550 [Adineta vaga]|nr:hypothetical protein I4U23_015550 [Adineta vaga]
MGGVIARELFDIGWHIYRLLFKPIIIVIILAVSLHYGYIHIICQRACSLPFVCHLCPDNSQGPISIPPFNKLAEDSTAVANVLVDADVDAPIRCIRAKTALIEIRGTIIHSDINPTIKAQLDTEIKGLQELMQTSADDLTDMLASFHGALGRMELYGRWGKDDLLKLIKTETSSDKGLPQIGYSEMKDQTTLDTSFNRYMERTNTEIDKILEQAQQAHMSLKSTENKLETIQQINAKGKSISEKRVNELQYGSWWSRLFDEGQLGIVKHQRNIKTLGDFSDFITKTLNNIGEIIIKLRTFKHDATHLKETIAIIDEFPVKSIGEHAALLELALEQLTQSKDIFAKRIESAKQKQ